VIVKDLEVHAVINCDSKIKPLHLVADNQQFIDAVTLILDCYKRT